MDTGGEPIMIPPELLQQMHDEMVREHRERTDRMLLSPLVPNHDKGFRVPKASNLPEPGENKITSMTITTRWVPDYGVLEANIIE